MGLAALTVASCGSLAPESARLTAVSVPVDVSAVPLDPHDPGIRFYLISDDNGSTAQRTYLLAFDWRSYSP